MKALFAIVSYIVVTAVLAAMPVFAWTEPEDHGTTQDEPLIGPRGRAEGQPEPWPFGVLGEFRKRGITAGFTYRGEAFQSIGLSPDNVTRYQGLAEAALNIDTEKAGLWAKGKLFVRGQNGHGQGINVTADGIAQPISDIDAPDFTQISQYGLIQGFFNGILSLDIGKRDVNAIFCVNGVAENFVSPGFALPPTVPMPTFPADALGLSFFVKPHHLFVLGLGSYDGAPKIGGLGFSTAFQKGEPYFSVFEARWEPAFGANRVLKGTYTVGLWYIGGTFQGTGSNADRAFSGNYGCYIVLNQTIYRHRTSGRDGRELKMFAQFGSAPSDRNIQNRFVSLGAVYTGLSKERHALGFGIGRTSFTPAGINPKRRHLLNVELFSIIRVASWFNLQPDIQYYSRSRGCEKNGFAPGVRSTLHF